MLSSILGSPRAKRSTRGSTSDPTPDSFWRSFLEYAKSSCSPPATSVTRQWYWTTWIRRSSTSAIVCFGSTAGRQRRAYTSRTYECWRIGTWRTWCWWIMRLTRTSSSYRTGCPLCRTTTTSRTRSCCRCWPTSRNASRTATSPWTTWGESTRSTSDLESTFAFRTSSLWLSNCIPAALWCGHDSLYINIVHRGLAKLFNIIYLCDWHPSNFGPLIINCDQQTVDMLVVEPDWFDLLTLTARCLQPAHVQIEGPEHSGSHPLR